MKIIENPNPRKERIQVCSDCQCKFTFDSNDVHSWSNEILGPGYRAYSWIYCPNCGKTITLE